MKVFTGTIPDLTTSLSYLLGKYMGLGLFENYPDKFNELMPKMAEELNKSFLSQILEVELIDIQEYITLWVTEQRKNPSSLPFESYLKKNYWRQKNEVKN